MVGREEEFWPRLISNLAAVDGRNKTEVKIVVHSWRSSMSEAKLVLHSESNDFWLWGMKRDIFQAGFSTRS